MSINDEVTEILRWVLTRLRRDSLIDDSLTVIFDVREQNDKYPRKQQQKLLARLQADGVITVKHKITFNDNLAMTAGQRAFGDFDTYAVTLLQPHFDTFYQKHVPDDTAPHAQQSQTITYKNGTIMQGNRYHTFSRSNDAIWLLHHLWPRRRTVDLNGTPIKTGKPMRIESLQKHYDAPSLEVIRSTRDSINATLRKKRIDAQVRTGKTIVLEVKEPPVLS